MEVNMRVQDYHPVRITLVERLERKRKEANMIALQARLLGRIAAKLTTAKDIARDTTLMSVQKEEEGFDLDASAPWRVKILEELTSSRATFTEVGRHIFDMELVCPLVKDVNVDDIVFDDTLIPYPSIYLHFGKPGGLVLVGEQFIDGVYVRADADDGDSISLTFVNNHPGWQATADVPLGKTFKQVSTAASLTISRGHSIGWAIENRSFWGAPEMLERPEALRSALQMTVNGLLYLNMAKADVEFAYPPQAPETLVSAVMQATKGGPSEPIKKLENLGYIRVNYVGRSIAFKANAISGSTGGQRSPHWRREHWRRVAVGEGRREREWRLFGATVVNGAAGPAKTGKIHVVKPVGDQGRVR
jgi:hypothetical protein